MPPWERWRRSCSLPGKEVRAAVRDITVDEIAHVDVRTLLFSIIVHQHGGGRSRRLAGDTNQGVAPLGVGEALLCQFDRKIVEPSQPGGEDQAVDGVSKIAGGALLPGLGVLITTPPIAGLGIILLGLPIYYYWSGKAIVSE